MQPPKLESVPAMPLFAYCPVDRIGFYFDGVLRLLPIDIEITQAELDSAWVAGWTQQPYCAHHDTAASRFVYQYACQKAVERVSQSVPVSSVQVLDAPQPIPF